ncbi:MAG: hypothetical protein U0703_20500 [Anaerolineae bacterium]
MRNILAQISVLGVFTTGMTFVMLCGEIDLSIAEVAGLTGTIATTLYANMDVRTLAHPGSIGVAICWGSSTAWSARASASRR